MGENVVNSMSEKKMCQKSRGENFEKVLVKNDGSKSMGKYFVKSMGEKDK